MSFYVCMYLIFSLHGVYDFIIKTFLTTTSESSFWQRFRQEILKCNVYQYHTHSNLRIHELKQMHTMSENVCCCWDVPSIELGFPVNPISFCRTSDFSYFSYGEGLLARTCLQRRCWPELKSRQKKWKRWTTLKASFGATSNPRWTCKLFRPCSSLVNPTPDGCGCVGPTMILFSRSATMPHGLSEYSMRCHIRSSVDCATGHGWPKGPHPLPKLWTYRSGLDPVPSSHRLLRPDAGPTKQPALVPRKHIRSLANMPMEV